MSKARHKPIIGLTTYPNSDTHGWHTPKLYVEAVIRAGGAPVLLPGDAIDSIDSWLARLDGFVFIGGGDIDPEYYGGSAHETIYNINHQRDRIELALMTALLENSKPTLAICRGLQVLNTVLGGSLYEHLPDAVGEAVLHRIEPRNDILHQVNIDQHSDLANLLGVKVKTASWHHQAIKKLGKGLKAVAYAPDGIIEAVEVDGNTDIVAVQWHPEITAPNDAGQQQLFNWLINRAQL